MIYNNKKFKPVSNSDNGEMRKHETWKWTSGDKSKENSILEEI